MMMQGRGRGPGGPGPGGMIGDGSDKANDFKGTMSRLAQYLAAYKVKIILVAIFAVLSTIFTIIGPKVLGNATTAVFNGVLAEMAGTGSIDFAYIERILGIMLVLYLFSALFAYLMGYIMAGVSTDITYRLRQDISQKMNRMPLSYFDKTPQGEVLSRITNDVDTVNQTLSQSLTQIITSVITVVGVLVMMLSISPLLTLASLLVIPISLGVVSFIIKRSQIYFREQQAYLGHVNGHVEEMFGGHRVMKAFNGEERSIAQFEEYNSTLYAAGWKSQFFSGLMMPIMGFIGNLGYVVVVVVGGYLAIGGSITVGDIQAFIQYVRQFNQPLAQLANISNVLQQTAAAAERVFAFLAEPEEVPEAAEPVTITALQGHVEFRNVRFGYDPAKPVIKNLSAEAQPGQKVAIVGPTGAGKTTIVKLLMRFYDVDEGAILVDGYDIRDLSRADLRRSFGMVLQDTWLYNASIMENIRYGRPEATDEEVIAAAEAAHVDHFVHTLPEGYAMEINEEVTNISQGQMQLLTIARAILADPKMLILDEATSSVDTRTEVLIQRAMDRLMEGRTSFIIAHRLSTIRNADLILVMQDGDIVEQGRHEELLARDSVYADLYYSQFDHITAAAEGLPAHQEFLVAAD
ncbi:MAG: ABC transporter ATP-binding protein [Anaerolineales bacterium]|nr:ABC transporter ATP-binding protein [Anaerolineales bacterium]MCO5179309.1 ABC transporter ATP-binding protein/permease [Promineifilum sp.]